MDKMWVGNITIWPGFERARDPINYISSRRSSEEKDVAARPDGSVRIGRDLGASATTGGLSPRAFRADLVGDLTREATTDAIYGGA